MPRAYLGLGRVPVPLLEHPVDVVLAFGGERLVDAVLVDLERAADRFLALGQGPGAQRIAYVLQLGHVTAIGGGGGTAALGAPVLHRTDRKSTRLHSSH